MNWLKNRFQLLAILGVVLIFRLISRGSVGRSASLYSNADNYKLEYQKFFTCEVLARF